MDNVNDKSDKIEVIQKWKTLALCKTMEAFQFNELSSDFIREVYNKSYNKLISRKIKGLSCQTDGLNTLKKENH